MNTDIQQLTAQIRQLQAELRDKIHAEEAKVFYRLEDGKIAFERHIREAHQRMRMNTLRWLASSSWRHLLSAPFIYSVFIPFAFLDLMLWMYQAVPWHWVLIATPSAR